MRKRALMTPEMLSNKLREYLIPKYHDASWQKEFHEAEPQRMDSYIMEVIKNAFITWESALNLENADVLITIKLEAVHTKDMNMDNGVKNTTNPWKMAPDQFKVGFTTIEPGSNLWVTVTYPNYCGKENCSVWFTAVHYIIDVKALPKKENEDDMAMEKPSEGVEGSNGNLPTEEA